MQTIFLFHKTPKHFCVPNFRYILQHCWWTTRVVVDMICWWMKTWRRRWRRRRAPFPWSPSGPSGRSAPKRRQPDGEPLIYTCNHHQSIIIQQNETTIIIDDDHEAHPNGYGDGEKFSEGESSAEPERDFPFRWGTRLHEVLERRKGVDNHFGFEKFPNKLGASIHTNCFQIFWEIGPSSLELNSNDFTFFWLTF